MVQNLKMTKPISVFDTSGIKHIYTNPYYPQGNGRIENVDNFLKHTVAKFIYSSSLKWDDVLPLATYCYNVAPSVDDLESPYYLIHGHDPLEGRLSNIKNYCRYMGNQPRRLAVQELQKLWKFHAKLLAENRMAEPAANKKIRPQDRPMGTCQEPLQRPLQPNLHL